MTTENTKPADQFGVWIDIRQRKPKLMQFVILASPQFGRQLALWVPEDNTCKMANHWMPAPEMPNVDPFEEWWGGCYRGLVCHDFKDFAKHGWNAALAHAKDPK